MKKDQVDNGSAARKQRRRRRRWRALLIVLGVLLVIRISLPYVMLRYINNRLAGLEEYRGHVEDIDIALLRGAYKINGISIKKVNADGQVDTLPFFQCPEIDLSVQWSALFKGKLVAEIYAEEPVLNFIQKPEVKKDKEVKEDTADFRKVIRGLMPLSINRFEVSNGQVHFIDPTRQPVIDVSMKNVQITADNLSNVNDSARLLPAGMRFDADAYGGHMAVNVKFDALNKVPTFDMNAELRELDLTQLNDFLRAYGNFDVKKGSFGLFMEFAAKDGGFGGYVKPVIKDMDVLQWNEDEGGIGQKLWEMVVGTSAEIVENQPRDQVASKIPVSGTFESPDIDVWKAISYVLRNGFVQALRPAIDHSISINRMKDERDRTLLEKVLGKDLKKKEKGRKDKKK
ncbi:MAG: DUF748 domain-containing protein [Bacteroidota bacterium]